MSDTEQRARDTYIRYGTFVEWKNFAGLAMPQWDELPPRIRQAWEAAVTEPPRPGPFSGSIDDDATSVEHFVKEGPGMSAEIRSLSSDLRSMDVLNSINRKEWPQSFKEALIHRLGTAASLIDMLAGLVDEVVMAAKEVSGG